MNKNNLNLVLCISLGIAIGMVFHNQIIPISLAKEVEIQEIHQYQKCLTVTSPRPHKNVHFNAGRLPVEDRMVAIPAGWNPVGGFGSGEMGEGLLILCK